MGQGQDDDGGEWWWNFKFIYFKRHLLNIFLIILFSANLIITWEKNPKFLASLPLIIPRLFPIKKNYFMIINPFFNIYSQNHQS